MHIFTFSDCFKSKHETQTFIFNSQIWLNWQNSCSNAALEVQFTFTSLLFVPYLFACPPAHNILSYCVELYGSFQVLSPEPWCALQAFGPNGILNWMINCMLAHAIWNVPQHGFTKEREAGITFLTQSLTWSIKYASLKSVEVLTSVSESVKFKSCLAVCVSVFSRVSKLARRLWNDVLV